VVFGSATGAGRGVSAVVVWAGAVVWAGVVVRFLGGVGGATATWTHTVPETLLSFASSASLGSVEAIVMSPSRPNAVTARALRGPQMPSAGPGLQPARRSSFWIETISGFRSTRLKSKLTSRSSSAGDRYGTLTRIAKRSAALPR